jgi:Tol biopolymer transport system component/predicted Ser/Thr protein kinase
MALWPGSKLGPYEIQTQIGAGGMGEVYTARDTRLNRTVAVKVCKEQFSGRFHREAEAVAALNHPHICHLYDVGPNYLVMEYVEGAQLKGPLPLERALQYGDQICQALDEAHRKGITHRDLKPANILVTKSAGVKLLDFGLARVEGGENATVTMEGLKGTPAYMSPEQWQGKPGDARSDIYAFGCVLYEMLSGQPAAAQRTKLEPPALESIVRTCLEKDPDARWQSASDLRRGLAMSMTVPTAPKRNPWRERTAWIAATVAIFVSFVVALRPSQAPAVPHAVRLSINPPEGTVLTGAAVSSVPDGQLALSPDGRWIVFAAAAAGSRPILWLRSLEAKAAQAMPGTEGADTPFWSPTSLSVGFFADGKLKRVNAAGGPVFEIADAPDNRGGAWGPDNTILFGTGASGIFRVSSSGGTVTPVTHRDSSRQEGSNRFPEWLPDGKHFLYSVRSGLLREQQGVYAGSLDGKTKKILIHGLTSARYAPSGHVIFMNGDVLMAQRFDAERLELQGQAFIVEDHIARSSFGDVPATISGTGILAYAEALSEAGRLTWFDRAGMAAGAIGPSGEYLDFRLSPDQTRLIFSLVDPKKGYPDLWLTDLALGNPAIFSFGDWLSQCGLWHPDGSRILFRTTMHGGVSEFYRKSAGGAGTEEPVLLEQALRDSGIKSIVVPSDWSPDGKHLLFTVIGTDTGLWLLPLDGSAKPVRYSSARGQQLHGNFSPDGHLVAYTSNESGRYEIYVQTFPLSDQRWTVSTLGGYEPRWRADGRELYYLSLDKRLMVVPVSPGPSFGVPRQLLQTRIPGGISVYRTHYVPSRDGERFLIKTQVGNSSPPPITVVLNWTAAFKK